MNHGKAHANRKLAFKRLPCIPLESFDF